MRRDESGSIAPAIPVIAIALLLLGGLGIDGSRQMNARGQAVAFAQEAARAGAQAQDPGESDLALDKQLAQQRVADYCARVEALSQVRECRFVRFETPSASDPREIVVVVQVDTRINSTLLSMIGVNELNARATGRARPFQGVNEAGDTVEGGPEEPPATVPTGTPTPPPPAP